MFKCGLQSKAAYSTVIFSTISCGLQSKAANNRVNKADT